MNMVFGEFLRETFDFDEGAVCEDRDFITLYDAKLRKDVGEFKEGQVIDAVSVEVTADRPYMTFEKLIPKEWELPDGGFTDVYQEGLDWTYAENEEMARFDLGIVWM